MALRRIKIAEQRTLSVVIPWVKLLFHCQQPGPGLREISSLLGCHGDELENDEILFQAREQLSPMGALTSFSIEAVGSDRHQFGSGKLLIW